jgi:hypothetical protein
MDDDKPIDHLNAGEMLTYFIIVMIFLGFALFWLVGVSGDSDQATRLLEEEGYTDITIGGGAVFGCGEGDWKRTSFQAKNRAGNYVRGVVCCGVAKGCTIRRK